MHAEPQPLFALAVAYALIWNVQALVLVRRIQRVDTQFEAKWGPMRGEGGLANAVIAVVFDGDLPKKEYVRSLRWHVYVCRAVFVTVPLAVIAAVVIPALGRG